MKKSLPCLSMLLVTLTASAAIAEKALEPASASSQVPFQAASERGSDHVAVGDRLLMQAATQLERRASISARLRHQVNLGGKQLYGVGSYWQQGSGEDLKVRLELQIAGQEAKLLQVCDSRFVWIDRRLPTGRSVSRIDLRQLRADPALATADLNDLEPGEASWSAAQPELTAYSGGLPSLLASLGDNFSFLPPQAMRLAIAPPLASEPTNVPVFAVVGQWKPDKLAALLSKSQSSSADGKQQEPANASSEPPKPIPERMPQEVLLLVGQADLFPYRIEYRRLETPQAASHDGPPIPYQLSVHPMIVLEMSDVSFDAPIAAGQFDYMPGDADWVDQTAALLERLRHQRQAQVARGHTDSFAPPLR